VEETLKTPGPLESALDANSGAEKKNDQGGSILDDIKNTLSNIDYRGIVTSVYFVPVLLIALGLSLAFWPLIKQLPERWTRDEYYSHGFAVPFIIAFIIYKKWPKLSSVKVESGFAAPIQSLVAFFCASAVSLVLAGYLLIAYRKFDVYGIQLWTSTALMLGAPMVMGSKWLIKKSEGADRSAVMRWLGIGVIAVLFAGFAVINLIAVTGEFWSFMSVFLMVAITLATWAVVGVLPVWGSIIDNYTNPLQLMSTKVAFALLKACGFLAYQPDPTTIVLNQFTLDVGIPCSGMKLMLAVSAFTALFTMIGDLKLWANQLMFAVALPFCLFINGLRIMLIGVVGDLYGADAGHKFHDYSGYITVVLCFVLLLRFARILGWKG
jgi:exosortase/archaeosortase family protein